MQLLINNWNDTGDFKSIDPGTYPARIIGVHDCGYQKPFNDEQEPRHTCCLVYEIDEYTDEGDYRLSITEPYTATLRSEKAKLRGPVEAAFPRLSDAQKDCFDMMSLIGKGVLITVAEKPNGRRKVSQVAPLLKGMEAHKGWKRVDKPFGLAKYLIEHQIPEADAEGNGVDGDDSNEAPADDIPF